MLMRYLLMKNEISHSKQQTTIANNNIMLYYYIVLLVLCLNLHVKQGHAIGYVLGQEVPAILVFGDSIVDSGNNNHVATIARANFPPYGRDFPGAVPTGRYSNGKVPSDFLAEELGIKEFVPPYLDPTLQISDLLTGVSFASGAAGYDPNSAKFASALSLEVQLEMFRGYINKLKGAVGENTTSTIISQSVYLICAGSNDITNTYFGLPITRLQYDVSTYTTLMTTGASSFLQELYALGARRIGVISAPPCGCLPSQRTLYGGLLRECAEEENQASILFNKKLFSELSSLNTKLPESRFVYLDIYNLILNLINNPSQSGFEIANKGCCGTGNIAVSVLCNKFTPDTCQNATKYIFWDSFHPTEAAYRILVHQLFVNNVAKFL